MIGTMDVTFDCVIVNDMGDQALTLWNLFNYSGVAAGQDLVSAYEGTVILSGVTTTTGVFDTFRNVATFTQFTEDLDGVTLACGTSTDLDDGHFFLRVYRKQGCGMWVGVSVCCIGVSVCCMDLSLCGCVVCVCASLCGCVIK